MESLFTGPAHGRWLALLALPFLVQISPLWYPTPDASCYLSLAKSIALERRPTNLGRAQLFHAPGYPLLISPAFLTGDMPFLLLSTIHCGLGILFLAGVFVWARRNLPAAALAITALCAVNVDILALYRRTLSEAAFMPLLIWTAIVLQPLAEPAPTRFSWGGLVLGSLLVAILALVRQAGILIAAGFGVVLMLETLQGRCSWRRGLLTTLAIGVPAAMVVAGISLYDQAMGDQATYFNYFRAGETSLALQLSEGVRLRVSEVGRLLIPGMFKAYGDDWLSVNLLVYVPLFGLVAVGWWRFLRSRRDLLVMLFPPYLALYIVWPHDQGTRFFAPLLPLLAACLWLALRRFGDSRRHIFAALAVAHAAVALGFWLLSDRPQARQYDALWPTVRSLAEPIGADAHDLAMKDTPPSLGLLFQVVVNRPVRDLASAASHDVRWLVTSAGNPVPAGFGLQTTAGDFTLWFRTATQEPTSR